MSYMDEVKKADGLRSAISQVVTYDFLHDHGSPTSGEMQTTIKVLWYLLGKQVEAGDTEIDKIIDQ